MTHLDFSLIFHSQAKLGQYFLARLGFCDFTFRLFSNLQTVRLKTPWIGQPVLKLKFFKLKKQFGHARFSRKKQGGEKSGPGKRGEPREERRPHPPHHCKGGKGGDKTRGRETSPGLGFRVWKPGGTKEENRCTLA